MELTLLGTGCPQVSTERYGATNLVRFDGKNYLVDCGSGATQRLMAAGCPGRDLDAIFLTHLHSDHAVDLFQLIISSWHEGRTRPHTLIGPPGTQSFVAALLAAWDPDVQQRISWEKRPSTLALQVAVREMRPSGGEIVWRDDRLTVRSVKVVHYPVVHAFGFVFDAPDHSLAFSGDTAPCPALEEAVRGTHVLVHECFMYGDWCNRLGPGKTAEGMQNIMSYHTSSSDVGKVASRAGVKCLVLNHFVPADGFDKSLLLADVRRDYAAAIIVGEDLMQICVATGEIRYAGGVIGNPLK